MPGLTKTAFGSVNIRKAEVQANGWTVVGGVIVIVWIGIMVCIYKVCNTKMKHFKKGIKVSINMKVRLYCVQTVQNCNSGFIMLQSTQNIKD